MNLSQFAYHLPKELIAKYPLAERCRSRLLTLDGTSGTLQHKQFTDLPDLIHPNDLLVFNNTQVLAARLFGQKETGGKVEILIERLLTNKEVLARVRASKKPKIDSLIQLENGIWIKVIGHADEFLQLQFLSQLSVLEILEQIGHIPLPPYLERVDEIADQTRYQTVFAKIPGAVAAPTAGLHFDKIILQTLRDKNIAMAEVTLHVGSGTFQPVRVTNIQDHKMHAEYMTINKEVCEKIQETKERGGRVIAVGTTTVRVLESASLTGNIQPYQGETKIFIYPGFKFNCVDAMVTNFHLPESSLLMLVCAFAGYEQVMKAYQEAIEQSYRFFSYGDAMLITKSCEKE
jgi:S-adenosylmethionine:tRNA ribosyltransferase-isomerase